jgi:glycosyltransferase involved in cell wall biosynthesis
MVGSAGVSTPAQALFVSYTSPLGGAERILLDQAAALTEVAAPADRPAASASRDCSVALACPAGPLADRARAAGIAVTPLRKRRIELRAGARDRLAAPLRIAAQARELRGIVSSQQPHVVVASGMRALLSGTAALSGTGARPPLVFVHNDLLPSPLVARAVRAAARRADLVVALSQAIADDLALDVEVIPPGVDLDRLRPTGPPPTDPPTALLLGAVVGWKRPDLALEAVALAARELPELRLRVAGAPLDTTGDELLARLRERAARPDLTGRVDFLGQVEDVSAALADSTCLLHCADREPYGMALVEALACGRPVAAPAAAGPLEIVDGSCGTLYAPGDARAAAAALVEVVRRADALGPAARTRAEANFDDAASGARFAALVEAVA